MYCCIVNILYYFYFRVKFTIFSNAFCTKSTYLKNIIYIKIMALKLWCISIGMLYGSVNVSRLQALLNL